MSNERIKRRIQFGIPEWEHTRNKLITLATPDFFSHYEPFHPIGQEEYDTAHLFQIESPPINAIEEECLLPLEPTSPIEDFSAENPCQEPSPETLPETLPETPPEPLKALDLGLQLEEPWSQELLEQYAKLPLPPMYDLMLQQEKVASELRRQNMGLQQAQQLTQQHAEATASALSGIEEQLHDMRDLLQNTQQDQHDLIDDDDALAFSMSPSQARAHTHQDARFVHLLERLEQRLATTVSPEAYLMDSLDALLQLLQATEKMASDIMAIVPFTSGFLKSSKPNWRIQLEKILESHLEGMLIVRNKLLIALTELGLTIIDAAPGDAFSPELHRAVERIPNQEYAGQISQLIRYGYMKDNIPLRYATVAVFY